MHRFLAFPAVALVACSLCSSLACGDLVIPSNGDDGGSSSGLSGDDAATDALPPAPCDAGVEPVALACTGLYSDWSHLIVAPDVKAFTPGTTMWLDGADASRWIWMPAGSKIDATDPNNWVFPVGTKIWQEIRLLGARIETRYEWKQAAGVWFRTTFAWNATENAAPSLMTGQPSARGLPYDIPTVGQCGQCHGGAGDFVLGFEAVSLAMPKSAGLNLQALRQTQMIAHDPGGTPAIPGDPTTTSALSFLHANCGTSCHNRGPDAAGGATGLFLKLTLDGTGNLPSSPDQTDPWLTSVNVASSLTPYGVDAGGFWRIRPGDPAHSSIVWTASRRDGVVQMPPIDTQLVDQNDVQLLSSWVSALPH
jgi:hypothetical protein